MEMGVAAGFWVVSFLLIITPGADWAYVISSGIHGRRIVPAVTGLMSGHLLATVAVVTGAGIVIARHPVALQVVTLLGAAWLLWLGISMLRSPAPIGAMTQTEGSRFRWMIKGLCISGLNPKVLLLFLALLPQFTDPNGRWPVAMQMSALGLIHLITCTGVYLLVGYGARSLLATRPDAAKKISLVSGVLMIAISTLLLVEQLK
ncbi:LysE family transporter [Enterobacteriaceae bacterium 4M9]|nr:LysE family transporter [Enterobacteriaceae bacterium 4M9]